MKSNFFATFERTSNLSLPVSITDIIASVYYYLAVKKSEEFPFSRDAS